MGTLLRMFHYGSAANPELLGQLKIEGRVLTDAQKQKLEESPVYQFYMKGRIARENFILPDSLRFTPERIALLLQGVFSPFSLEREIRYKVGYFSARELVDQWLSDGNINRLLPMLGGVNEFRIGSDTLSLARLAKIEEGLFQAFVEQERSKAQSPIASSINLVGLKSYALSSLKLNNNFNKKLDFIPNLTSFKEEKKPINMLLKR